VSVYECFHFPTITLDTALKVGMMLIKGAFLIQLAYQLYYNIC